MTPSILAIAIPIALALIAIIVICATGYVKASPDTAYVISGFKKQKELILQL